MRIEKFHDLADQSMIGFDEDCIFDMVGVASSARSVENKSHHAGRVIPYLIEDLDGAGS